MKRQHDYGLLLRALERGEKYALISELQRALEEECTALVSQVPSEVWWLVLDCLIQPLDALTKTLKQPRTVADLVGNGVGGGANDDASESNYSGQDEMADIVSDNSRSDNDEDDSHEYVVSGEASAHDSYENNTMFEFHYRNTVSFFALACLSRRWYILLSGYIKEKLDYLKTSDGRLISYFTELRELAPVDGVRWDLEGGHVQSLTALTSLEIPADQYWKPHHLASLTLLQHLHLTRNWQEKNDHHLVVLGVATRLRSLVLVKSGSASNQTLQSHRLRHLTRLVVSDCLGITDAGLPHLTNLRSLGLVRNRGKFHDAGLKALTALHVLDLSFSYHYTINGPGISERAFARLSELRALNLADTDYKGVTLQQLPHLETLNIYHNGEFHTDVLRKLPSLTQLCLGCTSTIGEQTWLSLASRLQGLVLYYDGRHNDQLHRMTALRRLALLGGSSFLSLPRQLTTLTRLEELTLDHWFLINDTVIECLPSLRVLSVHQSLPRSCDDGNGRDDLSLARWRERGVEFRQLTAFKVDQYLFEHSLLSSACRSVVIK